MKTFGNILKIIGALAAIAAIIFVIVRYGEAIVAWFKATLAKLGISCGQEVTLYETEDAPAEEDVIVAEEKDFEN